jgi:septal ring factor EnvC (AmiA/AmiB activator)
MGLYVGLDVSLKRTSVPATVTEVACWAHVRRKFHDVHLATGSPLCESHLATPVPSVNDISRSLAGLERQLESVHRDNPRLQARVAELEAKRAGIEGRLRTVQNDMAARIADNERLRIEQDQFTEQARVAGRVGYYLENVRTVTADDGLKLEVARLRAEVAALEERLDLDLQEERLSAALDFVPVAGIGRDDDLPAVASPRSLCHDGDAGKGRPSWRSGNGFGSRR